MTPAAGDVLGSTIKASVEKAVDNAAARKDVPEIKKADAGEVASAVLGELAQDPKFINATNSEPAYQSRVGIGSAAGVIGALGVLVPLLARQFGYEISAAQVAEVAFALVMLAGSAFSLYGRFRKGLKPLFSKK